MKLNNKLMLGFQKNQSSLHLSVLRNYQFMYIARDLLKTLINVWGDGCEGSVESKIESKGKIESKTFESRGPLNA